MVTPMITLRLQIALVLKIVVVCLALLIILIVTPQTGRKNNFLLRKLVEATSSYRTYSENRKFLDHTTWRLIFFFLLLTLIWGLVHPWPIWGVPRTLPLPPLP